MQIILACALIKFFIEKYEIYYYYDTFIAFFTDSDSLQWHVESYFSSYYCFF